MNTQVHVGSYLGLCNRSACRAPNASWWNVSTRHYYCRECARAINYNPAEKICYASQEEAIAAIGKGPATGDYN